MTGERPRVDEGLVRLLSTIARWSGRTIGFEAVDLMAARVVRLKRLGRLPKAFTVRAALPADEFALGSLVGDHDKARRLLASGDIGLVATAGGEIRAMEWVRMGPSDYEWDERRLGVVFRVPPRCCWLHNGQDGGEVVGPWAMILGRLPDLLEQRGIEAAFLQVESSNSYSRRCHESLGFETTGQMVAARFGGRLVTVVRKGGAGWERLRGSALDLTQVSA